VLGSLKLCLLVALAAACGPVQPIPEPTPPDPSPAPPGSCLAAHKRLEGLDCRKPDGSPWWKTPAGTDFAIACERAQFDGRDWNPECIATIEACSELERAYRGELCR